MNKYTESLIDTIVQKVEDDMKQRIIETQLTADRKALAHQLLLAVVMHEGNRSLCSFGERGYLAYVCYEMADIMIKEGQSYGKGNGATPLDTPDGTTANKVEK